jgi:putative membrane protein
MSNRLLAALAVSAALILVSCGAPSTPDFVRKAAMGDLYEIEAGKIAIEKGQSEAVKQFGQQMVDAHTKSSEELKAIVTAEKLDVSFRDKLGHRHQKYVDALNEAKPEAFDRIYVNQQVRTHAKAAELFDAYAEGGDNGALKQFAANALPTIKEQRRAAKKLAKTLAK